MPRKERSITTASHCCAWRTNQDPPCAGLVPAAGGALVLELPRLFSRVAPLPVLGPDMALDSKLKTPFAPGRLGVPLLVLVLATGGAFPVSEPASEVGAVKTDRMSGMEAKPGRAPGTDLATVGTPVARPPSALLSSLLWAEAVPAEGLLCPLVLPFLAPLAVACGLWPRGERWGDLAFLRP